MAGKVIDEAIGVRPLKLRPVLPVILRHENEGGTQKMLDV
jgi:hypothetical protein